MSDELQQLHLDHAEMLARLKQESFELQTQLQQEQVEMQTRLRETAQDKDTLVQRLRDQLEQERGEMHAKLCEVELNLENLKLQLQQSLDAQDTLASENSRLSEDLQTTSKEAVVLQEQVTRLESICKRKEERIVEMNNQLKSGHQHVEAVQGELGEAIAELTRKGAELQYMRDQHNTSQKENSDSSKRVEELENRVRQLQEIADRLKDEKQMNDQTLTSNLEKVNTALFEERTKAGKTQKELRAVSYTHLTLPTNRLV